MDFSGAQSVVDGLKHSGVVTQVATLAAHFNAQIPLVAEGGHLPVDRVAFEQSVAACRVARTEELEAVRDSVIRSLEDGDAGGAAKSLAFAGVVCNGHDVRILSANFVTLVTKGARRFLKPGEWTPATPEKIAEAVETLTGACWACLTLINNEIDNRDPEARRALEDMGG
jgi:hypothetical protein